MNSSHQPFVIAIKCCQIAKWKWCGLLWSFFVGVSKWITFEIHWRKYYHGCDVTGKRCSIKLLKPVGQSDKRRSCCEGKCWKRWKSLWKSSSNRLKLEQMAVAAWTQRGFRSLYKTGKSNWLPQSLFPLLLQKKGLGKPVFFSFFYIQYRWDEPNLARECPHAYIAPTGMLLS